MGWLNPWLYRKSHITNGVVGGGEGNHIGIKVYYGAGSDGTETIDGVIWGKVYLDSKSETDFVDFRPTDDDGDTILDHALIEKTDSSYAMFWVRVDDDCSSNQTIYIYYGNAGASSASNMRNTFPTFGEDFLTQSITPKYITNWTKSGNNPLKDLNKQGWLVGVYSNYGGEDKIYLFFQWYGLGHTTMNCISFTRANFETVGNWTDHGTIFTTTQSWSDQGMEPHGILWEAQAMADAREGVGSGLGTRKWRIYYGGNTTGGLGTSGIGFITASEDNLLSWGEYSGNPVIPKYCVQGTEGHHDCKAGIYDNKAFVFSQWYGTVKGSVSVCHFSVSDDGINNWMHGQYNWARPYEAGPIGTIVPFDTGLMICGMPGSTYLGDDYYLYFVVNGHEKREHAGNPILSGGGGGAWDEGLAWYTLVIDKDGDANLNGVGTYYLYYVGATDWNGAFKLGVATADTLTEPGASNTDLESLGWRFDTVGTGFVIDSANNRAKIERKSGETVWAIHDYFLYNYNKYVLEGTVEFAQIDKNFQTPIWVERGAVDKLAILGHGDGYIYYASAGGYTKSSETYIADTKYRFKIIIDETTHLADIWFNGVEIVSGVSYIGSPTNDPDKWSIYNNGTGGIFYVYYTFMRENIDPGHGAWGSEEAFGFGSDLRGGREFSRFSRISGRR